MPPGASKGCMRRAFQWAALGLALTCDPARLPERCTPGTPLEEQNRTEVKHRNPAQGVPITPTSVADMLTWQPPANLSEPAVRSSNSLIDPRESQGFALEGDVWLVHFKKDDCDIHLEITMPGEPESAARIIAEIPQGPAFLAARSA